VRTAVAASAAAGLLAPLGLLAVATPAQAEHTEPPTSVTLVGNLQSESGCENDWDPACEATAMAAGDAGMWGTTLRLGSGTWEYKVAVNGTFDESYGGPGGANLTLTLAQPAVVRFGYDATSHAITSDAGPGTGVQPSDRDLARPSLRNGLEGEKFYFVMPDRFANGRTDNDDGGIAGGPLQSGLDPTHKGFYHGGDLAGLLSKLDYVAELGTTAIWMTPMFKNKPVQGEDPFISAGYHGYWITDFTQIDPHFGTNAELAEVIDEAHKRGIKVFFDIITNHTADVIKYGEGQYAYRNKAAYPYLDKLNREFDDRDYAGKATFPELSLDSFPYTPVFPTQADATVKKPAWLNDRTLYHNRGDTTFVGEDSQYGDFFGLDDLFTERPEVVQGMTRIFQSWITELDIDGYRIDTVKHVNDEFWQVFAPAIKSYARAHGKPDFFAFGEVFDADPSFTSRYTTTNRLQAVLDFPFQDRARTYASKSGPSAVLRDLFAEDDRYLDADSNAYALPTFLGNHDMGRIGTFLRQDNPDATDAELLARHRLAHSLMYFSRGNPVVYYGDEQGFVGDGGDQDAREDMFPSQVATYNDNDLIGTDETTATDNYDTDDPTFVAIRDLAGVTKEHKALRTGAQVHRLSSDAAGVYAFSRIDSYDQVEYVVAVNNAETEQTVAVPTYSADQSFSGVYPTGLTAATSAADATLSVTVPALSAVVYRADARLAPSAAAPGIVVTPPPAGSTVTGSVELGAQVGGNGFNTVTFAVREKGAKKWTRAGSDDNAPYRVFYDTAGHRAGTELEVRAIVSDNAGHLDADSVSVTVGEVVEPEPPTGAVERDYLVVHYQRPAGDYDGWGLHAFGDVETETPWTDPAPFAGEDSYGRFAWVKLAPGADNVGIIVHNGDTKDPADSPDRFVNPRVTPEVWLKSGDATVYSSQAAAQGFVRIHYNRPAGDYTGSGAYVFGGVDDSELTEYPATQPFDGEDSYGRYVDITLKPGGEPVGFIILNNGVKDTEPDRFIDPATTAQVWIQQGDETIYRTAGDAADYAEIHYRRADANYDGWGLHVWTGAANPTEWTSPILPERIDSFGAVFRVPLVDGAPTLNYIIHKGDEKDLPADQALDLDGVGHEVWYLSGAVGADGQAEYLLPVQAGPSVDVDLTSAKAQWLTRGLVAWNVAGSATHAYSLRFANDGGITAGPGGISGGRTIRLTWDPAGLSEEEKAAYPHLAAYSAFRVDPRDAALIGGALRGQIVAIDRDDTGLVRTATGVQIAGVLDDIYGAAASAVRLGPTVDGDGVTLRLWAPTAHWVHLDLYADARAGTRPQRVSMTRDGASGVWTARGNRSWLGRYYTFGVKVWAPSVSKLLTNTVTDPYSLALATNSTRSLIVDLDAAGSKPAGWDTLAKPELPRPERSSIYELHVRDFSITDETVPAGERGTYRAFTRTNSAGMRHLRDLASAGLTTVHLLPVFDIATIEERRAAQQEPNCDLASYPPDSAEQQECVMAVADSDGFNWGYDPLHYTAPEGSYATSPDGISRNRQFREMVAGLNRSGLRVVMDVVYNHTAASGQDQKSVLDRIVPGYYHRLDENGAVATSTCCANTATENTMMGKLMIDSIVTWARQYKVDGFRFDLMGHHSKANMLAVRAALDGLTMAKDGVNGRKIYVYGEGWNFGEVADNARFVQATQANMAGTQIGTFNDRLRDAVRGGGPFDENPRVQGFGSGLYTDPNGDPVNGTTEEQRERLLRYQDQIKVGLTGNLAGYRFVDRTGATVTGSQVDYNGSPAGYTADPEEAITYVDAHDNETLYDALAFKLPQETSMADRIRMNTVSLSTVALGQGVAFSHAGAELLRSKSLDRNSYNSGDWFNKLDFSYSTNNFGVGLPPEADNASKYDYMRPLLADPDLRAVRADILAAKARASELLRIRESTALFALGTAARVQEKLSFPTGGPEQPAGVITMVIDDTVGTDFDPARERVVVVFNASDEPATVAPGAGGEPGLALHKVQATGSDEVVKTSTVGADGTLSVPARTTAVFVR